MLHAVTDLQMRHSGKDFYPYTLAGLAQRYIAFVHSIHIIWKDFLITNDTNGGMYLDQLWGARYH